jgi:hypothetical protein
MATIGAAVRTGGPPLLCEQVLRLVDESEID